MGGRRRVEGSADRARKDREGGGEEHHEGREAATRGEGGGCEREERGQKRRKGGETDPCGGSNVAQASGLPTPLLRSFPTLSPSSSSSSLSSLSSSTSSSSFSLSPSPPAARLSPLEFYLASARSLWRLLDARLRLGGACARASRAAGAALRRAALARGWKRLLPRRLLRWARRKARREEEEEEEDGDRAGGPGPSPSRSRPAQPPRRPFSSRFPSLSSLARLSRPVRRGGEEAEGDSVSFSRAGSSAAASRLPGSGPRCIRILAEARPAQGGPPPPHGPGPSGPSPSGRPAARAPPPRSLSGAALSSALARAAPGALAHNAHDSPPETPVAGAEPSARALPGTISPTLSLRRGAAEGGRRGWQAPGGGRGDRAPEGGWQV